jgi:ABC-type glutathione transport system ATPase component
MEEQRELGKAMLIVSHDMEFLIQSADAMIWLDQGRVRGVGDPFRVGHTYLRWMHKKDEVGREKADTHVEQLERDVQQYMAENKIDEKSIPEQLLPATLLTKGNLTGVDAE